MKTSGDRFARLDLKCDFPARESFRESLLECLQAINEQGVQTTAIEEDDFAMRELSDSELDMLAAAQGPTLIPDNTYGDSSSLLGGQ